MSVNKFRWSKNYESAEEELIYLLKSKNIEANRIAVDSEESLHFNPNVSIIWCAEGSMKINAKNAEISMQAGDYLVADKEASITGQSGIFGCVYYISK